MIMGLHCSCLFRPFAHLALEFRGSRYGIEPTPGPGMTPHQPAHRVPGPAQRTVRLDRPQRIRRAGRPVAADVAVERADHEAVGLQQADQHVLHGRFRFPGISPACQADERSSISRSGRSEAAGKARITIRARAGFSDTSRAAACRSRRFTRFRWTALPTLRPTTKPIFGPDGSASAGSSETYSIRVGRRIFRPVEMGARNSAESRIRSRAGNTRTALGSARQPRAPLATPRRQDRPARAGAHPQPEPVGPAPTTVAWLERALAHGTSPISVVLNLWSEWVPRPTGRNNACWQDHTGTTNRAPVSRQPHQRYGADLVPVKLGRPPAAPQLPSYVQPTRRMSQQKDRRRLHKLDGRCYRPASQVHL